MSTCDVADDDVADDVAGNPLFLPRRHRVAAAFVRLQLHGRTEGAPRDERENPMAPPIDEDADMVDFGQKVDLCQRIRDVRANHRASNLARTL